MRKRLLVLIAVLFCFDIFLFFSLPDQRFLKVTFLDVGQGDATLISSPSGSDVLVDTGQRGTGAEASRSALPFFDRELDVLVLTHPDADHIGDAETILQSFRVKKLLLSGDYSGDMEKQILAKAKERGTKIIQASRGQIIDLGDGAYLSVLFPDRPAEKFETNTSSIVLELTYGKSKFLLTGDLPANVEDYLVRIDGSSLDSEVLKLGHHGSKTSTSDSFLKIVSPKYAVVSAGLNNKYGHPSPETLNKIKNAEVLQTAVSGNIKFFSDGLNVWQ